VGSSVEVFQVRTVLIETFPITARALAVSPAVAQNSDPASDP
jgi:hypothetical protein